MLKALGLRQNFCLSNGEDVGVASLKSKEKACEFGTRMQSTTQDVPTLSFSMRRLRLVFSAQSTVVPASSSPSTSSILGRFTEGLLRGRISLGLRFWTSSSMCEPVMVMDDPLAVVILTVLDGL